MIDDDGLRADGYRRKGLIPCGRRDAMRRHDGSTAIFAPSTYRAHEWAVLPDLTAASA